MFFFGMMKMFWNGNCWIILWISKKENLCNYIFKVIVKLIILWIFIMYEYIVNNFGNIFVISCCRN